MQWFADWLVYYVIGLTPQETLGAALNFFVYDTLKIFLLLTVIMFAVAVIRSYFPAERARKLLGGKKTFLGNIIAALLGIVTPFCSCSAVPLFIGFVEAGIPLGVTLTFLISSPMVNEVALGLLWIMFGWKIALLYISTGLVVAIAGGWVIGRMKMEYLIEDYILQAAQSSCGCGCEDAAKPLFAERLSYAREYTLEILRKIWPYIIVAVGIGAFVHGYAPEDFLAKYAGKDIWYAVPLAVLLGIPLYANCAGALPIAAVLIEKGVSMGTALAFMMSVTALSLPEMIILRRVMKPKLIAVFVSIVGIAIICTGYLFNMIL
ncbi:MAG: permease [Negativicutes bacterium]|jgi:hypothetical protein